MFPSIRAQGKSCLITVKRIESGDSGMLDEAPKVVETVGVLVAVIVKTLRG